jgi:predicted Kef-type K+ transport protein
MDIVWIVLAFAFGLAVRQVGLPPLVGYLLAGFLLASQGAVGGETVQRFADMGVTLLLFIIGLKLDIRGLKQPSIWGTASVHMLVTVLLFAVGLYALGSIGLAVVAGLDFQTALLVGFALSFSSTVFAVKVLESKGEMSALYGRIAIGILIMQDIAAVVFIAFSTGKVPSPWALLLLGVVPLRFVLFWIMERSGHGELLVLFGLSLALGGAQLCEFLNVKGDLGALLLGVLMAKHAKASELSRALYGFKDLFLVGFFLNIGLAGMPTLQQLGIALLLTLVMPLKVALFFFLLTRFRLRVRTSMLTAFSLANYSEFGLIVGAIGMYSGWLDKEWLTIIAIALSVTFILAAPLNTAAHNIYMRISARLKHFEHPERLPEERPIDVGDTRILIFGMGHVGENAYDVLQGKYGQDVTGVDFDERTVASHRAAGRNVVLGSATDPDFWSRLHLSNTRIELILLALPNHEEDLQAARELAETGYRGKIAATVKFDDQVEALHQAGIHAAFNLYAEAGAGFAEHASGLFGEQPAGR